MSLNDNNEKLNLWKVENAKGEIWSGISKKDSQLKMDKKIYNDLQEKFEDTKLVFISRKSKSDRQHNDQKKKNRWLTLLKKNPGLAMGTSKTRRRP